MRGRGLWAVALAAAQMLAVSACAGGDPAPARAPDTAKAELGEARTDLGAAGILFAAPSAAEPGEPQPPSDGAFPATRVPPGNVPIVPPDTPSRGPSSAPVTIQIFSDFECPYCALAARIVRELEAEFGGSIRFVWRNFPLPMHPHARLAAAAALEVYAERGGAAFWRFHDAIFSAQERGLDPASIERAARRQGVDPVRYRGALAAGAHDARILADLMAGEAAGVNGTPAFFVNDWLAVGVLPYAEFRAIVLQALRDTER